MFVAPDTFFLELCCLFRGPSRSAGYKGGSRPFSRQGAQLRPTDSNLKGAQLGPEDSNLKRAQLRAQLRPRSSNLEGAQLRPKSSNLEDSNPPT